MFRSSLLFITLFVLALSGCSPKTDSSSTKDYSGTYPKQFYDNFYNACVKSAMKMGQRSQGDIQKACSCAADTVKKNIPFPDYIEMEQGLNNSSAQTKKGEAAYQRMMELLKTCR